MMPELRPYQTEVIGTFRSAVNAGRKHVMLVAPTGSGKTVIAGAIVNAAVADGKRVLFFSHRREITKQTINKLHDVGMPGSSRPGFPRACTSRSRLPACKHSRRAPSEDQHSSCHKPILSS